MKKAYKTLLATALLLGSVSVSFASSTYTKETYNAAKKQAEMTYEVDDKACSLFKDNAKDICDAKAKAKRIHNIA